MDMLYLHWWWWAGLLAALGTVNGWIDSSNKWNAKHAASKSVPDSPPRVDAAPSDDPDESSANPAHANNTYRNEPRGEFKVTDVAAAADPVRKTPRSNVTASSIVVAAIVLIGLYTFTAPYLSAFYIYTALERHDQPALERVVAFDDLRENLKRRLPAIPPTAIDEMVTPSAVMTALQSNSPSVLTASDAAMLGVLMSSMHKDDYGRFVIADSVVLCNYYLLWRVCDIAIK